MVSRTPSEIIATRADAAQPDMGLRTWPGDQIRKQDAVVSKNYLSEPEIRELNRLTTILLDIFEDQADLGRLVVMEDAARLLERQLKGLERAVLNHGGSVSAAKAKAHAERQYGLYDERRKAARHDEANKTINELAKEAKRLPGKR